MRTACSCLVHDSVKCQRHAYQNSETYLSITATGTIADNVADS